MEGETENLGDYKGVGRWYSKKIRRAKAKLEFNLASVIKDNKKSFYKSLGSKRKAQESLHSLLGAEGSAVSGRRKRLSLIQNLVVLRMLSSQGWKMVTGS